MSLRLAFNIENTEAMQRSAWMVEVTVLEMSACDL